MQRFYLTMRIHDGWNFRKGQAGDQSSFAFLVGAFMIEAKMIEASVSDNVSSDTTNVPSDRPLSKPMMIPDRRYRRW
jgi:hypothetical protein